MAIDPKSGLVVDPGERRRHVRRDRAHRCRRELRMGADHRSSQSDRANSRASRRRWADRICSSCGGRRRTWLTHRRKRCHGCSCCLARTTAIRNSAGVTRWRRAGLDSSNGRALGPQYDGDLFVGAARTDARRRISVPLQHHRKPPQDRGRRSAARRSRRRQQREVRHHRERELLFGRNFGVGTDVQTGPNGNLYVVSLDRGVIYEVFRK